MKHFMLFIPTCCCLAATAVDFCARKQSIPLRAVTLNVFSNTERQQGVIETSGISIGRNHLPIPVCVTEDSGGVFAAHIKNPSCVWVLGRRKGGDEAVYKDVSGV